MINPFLDLGKEMQNPFLDTRIQIWIFPKKRTLRQRKKQTSLKAFRHKDKIKHTKRNQVTTVIVTVFW